MTLLAVLGLSLAFVAVNAIFVAAEFALIASPRATLETQASAGDRSARRVLDILGSSARQDRYIATAQLGITLASLGLGMYGEHGLALILEPWIGHVPFIGAVAGGTLLALFVLTILHIVVGEMLPKGLALQHPLLVWRVTSWPMRLTLLSLYPFVRGSSALAGLVLRVFGIRRTAEAHDQVYTPEELQLIVEESHRGGALHEESGKILRELFEFGDRTAAQVMVPRVRVSGIAIGATPDDIRKLVTSRRRTRYAVYDGDLDHIIGMLHVKDLLRLLMQNERVSASEARRIPVVPDSASLDAVLTTMERTRAHMAVVIDEHGGTAGIVNLEDLFEEVVGDIDEGLPSAPAITRMPDGSVLAAGTVRLDELGRQFDLDLEHDEVESVSGLILARLGRPPEVGDAVEYDELRLEVTAVSGRGVRQARVTRVPDTAPGT